MRWPPPRGWVWGAFLAVAAAFSGWALLRGLDDGFTISMVLLLIFSGLGAVLPRWRYVAGEALLGSAVLLVVITYLARDGLMPSLASMAGAAMLAVVGVIQLSLSARDEEHPSQATVSTGGGE
ncbi:MAG TPA: hypothetical protein VHN80_31510 [Kineosporiaceae bacterium]|jgi:hypothetical protein|nr:hypothetical protein [Kineosporiaceae bacterium]